MLIGKQHRLWFYIYGFNITIIAWLFTLLFSRLLGKRKGALLTAIGIITYTLLVGANPAVLRAAFPQIPWKPYRAITSCALTGMVGLN